MINRFGFGKARVPECECTYNFTCGACLRAIGPTIVMECPHNRMSECKNGKHVWHCADCGYLYGQGVAMSDKPLADKGLTSYRYRGQYGFVMIGASDNADALREAARSVEGVIAIDRLEIWDGSKYRKVV